MKLGVLTVLYQDLTVEATLDKLAELGVEAVEFGTGNYPGNAHCNPDELLADPAKARALQVAVRSRGMIISALSCHGNPLHPDEEAAGAAHEVWRKTARLAAELEVAVVNTFSGCPGDHPGAKYPNWVTCAWPPDYLEVLDWQWNERVVPYWTEEAGFARELGIVVGFEMHPGFVVYNPETLLRLRAAAGAALGANFDPSHLFWQGIDPVEAIKELGDAIFHFHAKDTALDAANVAVNGVLDTKGYDKLLERSWLFRTVGYGHGEKTWRDIVSVLRAVGYDYVMSIEHEDALASIDEGLTKAVRLLQNVLLAEKPVDMWWA
ncbi:MAG: sugar phosphate isomerase/epimerase family protein [Actinomycetota bacterium]